MSHITVIEIQIKDLDALEAAARELGLELRRGQTTYDWYGRKVGNDPMPEGFTVADLGKCDHAITIPGNERAYEVGVCASRNGEPGYTLMWDFWNGGYGLQDKIGQNGQRLIQEYAVQVAMNEAMREGFRVTREVLEDGRVVLSGMN